MAAAVVEDRVPLVQMERQTLVAAAAVALEVAELVGQEDQAS